jgi:hypothetical protein
MFPRAHTRVGELSQNPAAQRVALADIQQRIVITEEAVRSRRFRQFIGQSRRQMRRQLRYR